MRRELEDDGFERLFQEDALKYIKLCSGKYHYKWTFTPRNVPFLLPSDLQFESTGVCSFSHHFVSHTLSPSKHFDERFYIS